jgi:hypothetical protein
LIASLQEEESGESHRKGCHTTATRRRNCADALAWAPTLWPHHRRCRHANILPSKKKVILPTPNTQFPISKRLGGRPTQGRWVLHLLVKWTDWPLPIPKERFLKVKETQGTLVFESEGNPRNVDVPLSQLRLSRQMVALPYTCHISAHCAHFGTCKQDMATWPTFLSQRPLQS